MEGLGAAETADPNAKNVVRAAASFIMDLKDGGNYVGGEGKNLSLACMVYIS